jgi:hypothetical protein
LLDAFPLNQPWPVVMDSGLVLCTPRNDRTVGAATQLT